MRQLVAGIADLSTTRGIGQACEGSSRRLRNAFFLNDSKLQTLFLDERVQLRRTPYAFRTSHGGVDPGPGNRSRVACASPPCGSRPPAALARPSGSEARAAITARRARFSFRSILSITFTFASMGCVGLPQARSRMACAATTRAAGAALALCITVRRHSSASWLSARAASRTSSGTSLIPPGLPEWPGLNGRNPEILRGKSALRSPVADTRETWANLVTRSFVFDSKLRLYLHTRMNDALKRAKTPNRAVLCQPRSHQSQAKNKSEKPLDMPKRKL